MSANENEFGLQVDPSEKTGEDRFEAAGQEDFDLNVDPSEGPKQPPE
jgi:hypothetical protein